MNSSLATSRRAAQQHAIAVAVGRPRSTRWTAASAGVSAVAAAVALPLFPPASLALVAVAGLLLAVHRQDRRDAWRYAPQPVTPARFLPPLRPPRSRRPSTARTEPVTPVVEVAHVPANAVPAPRLPQTAAGLVTGGPSMQP